MDQHSSTVCFPIFQQKSKKVMKKVSGYRTQTTRMKNAIEESERNEKKKH